jgi:thiol-disulfide isomerase/thioredoxin
MLAMATPAMFAIMAMLGCGGGDDGTEREEIRDLEFPAFLDGETDVEPTSVRLSDYFAENRPGTRLLMINTSAGWCSPCMREAEAMSAFADTFEPRGVAIVMAIFQDQNGDPADAEFVKAWVDTFEVSVPALIDTSFQLSEYVDVDVMPVNLFVDAESQEILEIAHGAETGDDPMKEYRELLDFYLDE